MVVPGGTQKQAEQGSKQHSSTASALTSFGDGLMYKGKMKLTHFPKVSSRLVFHYSNRNLSKTGLFVLVGFVVHRFFRLLYVVAAEA